MLMNDKVVSISRARSPESISGNVTKDDASFNYGNGGGGDDMQARVAKLESDIEHIKNTLKEIKEDVREIKRDTRSDFRILFGALITLALGLAGLMAKGFNWL